MADEVDNDDQWLYGDQSDINQEEKPKDPEPVVENPEEPKENGIEEPPPVQTSDDIKPPGVDDEPEKESEDQQKEKENDKDENDGENGDAQKNGDDEGLEDDDDDDDDSEDDVNVVIEDIKSTPAYTSLNIKRGGLLSSSTNVDKSKQQQQQAGKFTVEEFDQAGTINGVPATEYNLDSLEDKPWRKPGADITDYFNYGFNEDTWRAYCERQKRMRMTESGAGLAAQMGAPPRGTVPILNDNSKYSGNFLGVRKAGPPPGRRMTGSIDVIGGTAQRATPTPVGKVEQTKMNVIQVMTADRREYSRKPTGFPDMSVPPPNSFEEYQPEYGFNPEPDPYYGGYEPTQDLQWGPDGEAPNWAQNEIKPTTPVSGPPPPSSAQQNMHMVPPPISSSNNNSSVPAQQHSPHSPNRRDSKDRERDSERGSSRGRERSERPDRERSRDRDRERSHRRKRSRSRSRRHKSRSRSPSHRSHRKKKGRRHDDSD